jgi:hypothetical protein
MLAGTDTGTLPAQMLYGGAVAAVAALTGLRAVTARRARRPRAAAARQTGGVDQQPTRGPGRAPA